MSRGSRTIGHEIHVREDVALDVDARRDFDQLHALAGAREDAALRDVEARLPVLRCVGAVEGDLLHSADELA